MGDRLVRRGLVACAGGLLAAVTGLAGFLVVVNVGVRAPWWLILVLPVCAVVGVLLIRLGSHAIAWALDN